MEQEGGKAGRFGDCSEVVIGACIDVHGVLGRGLLESAYEQCLAHEFPSRTTFKPTGTAIAGLGTCNVGRLAGAGISNTLALRGLSFRWQVSVRESPRRDDQAWPSAARTEAPFPPSCLPVNPTGTGTSRPVSQIRYHGHSVETFGRFRDLVPLGEGGMGRVLLARAVGPGGFAKPVVVKRMHDALAKVPELVERFLEEARLQANLVCPNIVQVLDFGRMGETYFLVLEYVHGIDLGLLLRESKGPLPIGVAVRIAADVCRGLDYAHRARGPTGEPLGLVHRDVSPQNVLVSYEGDVKLGDFGLARTGGAEEARPGAIYGKPAYLAPEQARGGASDARADLFALGTVLYFELTGQSPFRGESRSETLSKVIRADFRPIEELRPEVPAPLASLVCRAMQADPEQRFPDAATMLAELEAVALTCGKDAGLRAVRDHVQSLFPGAAEKDPWSGTRARGPVVLELSRLVAEDGITVLTEADSPSVLGPPRAQGSRYRWAILAAALSTVALVAVAIGMGRATPPSHQGPRERPAASAEGHPKGETRGAHRPSVGEPQQSTSAGREVGAANVASHADAGAPSAPRHMGRASVVAQKAPRKVPARDAGAAVQQAEPAAPPATGRLRVGTTPGWGWVFVDGRRVGTTPLDVVVEAGVRQVKIVGGRSGRERDLPVRVEPGRTGSVFLESFE